jgi:hypothetical protein
LPGSPQPSHGYHRCSLGRLKMPHAQLGPFKRLVEGSGARLDENTPRFGYRSNCARSFTAPSCCCSCRRYLASDLRYYSKAHVNVRQVPDGFLRQIQLPFLHKSVFNPTCLTPRLLQKVGASEDFVPSQLRIKSSQTRHHFIRSFNSQTLPNGKRDHAMHNPNASSLVV